MSYQYTNKTILDSIPLAKPFKRYWVKKFQSMCQCNGTKYASERMKTFREALLSYRANPDRNIKEFLHTTKLPFRKNGWLKAAFNYVDCQPEACLNFFKLYVGMLPPVITVEESSAREHEYLLEADKRVNTQTPVILKRYLGMLKSLIKSKQRKSFLIKKYNESKRLKYSTWHKLSCQLSLSDWCTYWYTWMHNLKPADIDPDFLLSSFDNIEPRPELYKDKKSLRGHVRLVSGSFDRDLWNFYSMSYYHDLGFLATGDPAISKESWDYCASLLDTELSKDMDSYWESHPLTFRTESIDGSYVGQIHHIPKKGTVKRRPIAVPNRFLQMGLIPFMDYLGGVLSKLPRDCTNNQERFNSLIQQRLNQNLYVGSVDLSQATDNLPLKWGQDIVELMDLSYAMSNERGMESSGVLTHIIKSKTLFYEIARGRWRNGDFMSSWTVGQPLGTLPSFNMLGVTHNVLLESISASCGYGSSPYAILGDDVVIFERKVRDKYIHIMESHGVPLSLHKSYVGNLTEFSGKTFVKNHINFHTSDHGVIHLSNLFDYQIATGIIIPWNKLPCKLRDKFTRLVESSSARLIEEIESKQSTSSSFSELLSSFPFLGMSQRSKGKFIYESLQEALVWRNLDVSNRKYNLSDEALSNFWFQYYSHDELMPDTRKVSGIILTDNTFTSITPREGKLLRDIAYEKPTDDWFKQKFRPATTDALIHCMVNGQVALIQEAQRKLNLE